MTHQRFCGITREPLPEEGTVEASLSFPGNDSVLYVGTFLVSGHLFSPLQCVLAWDFLTSNGLNLFLNLREHMHYKVLACSAP